MWGGGLRVLDAIRRGSGGGMGEVGQSHANLKMALIRLDFAQ